MALHKIRKHSIKGCLLVQFKYIENEGDFTTSSTSFVAVAGKNITMTPQYADSIIETSASFSIVDTANTQNTTMTFETALYVNGSEEHVQGQLGGFTPHGNDHSHTGGRNDRTAPTRRHGHVTNITKAVNYTHAFQCRNTNSQILETRVRCTSAVSYRTRDFFMIAKEIGVTVDNVTGGLGSGSVNEIG